MNYYKVLGVNQDADEIIIKKQYKMLSKRYHPDKNLNNIEEAKEVFIKVNEAYEVLSDKEKRKSYDQYLNFFVTQAEFFEELDRIIKMQQKNTNEILDEMKFVFKNMIKIFFGGALGEAYLKLIYTMPSNYLIDIIGLSSVYLISNATVKLSLEKYYIKLHEERLPDRKEVRSKK